MARTTDRPSAAIRPNTARVQLDTDGLGDNGQRRENLSAVHNEPRNDRDDSRWNRDDEPREQSPALSAGLEAYAPVLEAWRQVFKSWSELTETMVKAQQDAFASMISTANSMTRDKR
jgi:hypothetical protein